VVCGALGIRGCSVSMPFKEDVIPLVDKVEPSAAGHPLGQTRSSTTTGRLTASEHRLHCGNNDSSTSTAWIRTTHCSSAASGGMASAVGAAFRDKTAFTPASSSHVNPEAGRALAQRLGYDYAPSVGDRTAPIIVNVTPIGMAGAPEASEVRV